MSIRKMSVTDVCLLIKEIGYNPPEIAEQSGWAIKSVEFLYTSGIYKEELQLAKLEDTVESSTTERLDAEQFARHNDDLFYVRNMYEREEGDPVELDFND